MEASVTSEEMYSSITGQTVGDTHVQAVQDEDTTPSAPVPGILSELNIDTSGSTANKMNVISPTMASPQVQPVQYIDERTKVLGRKAELEALRKRKSLEGKKEKFKSDSPLKTSLAAFYLEQQKMKNEVKASRQGALSSLSQYRSKDSDGLFASTTPRTPKQNNRFGLGGMPSAYSTMADIDGFYRKQKQMDAEWREKKENTLKKLSMYRTAYASQINNNESEAIIESGEGEYVIFKAPKEAPEEGTENPSSPNDDNEVFTSKLIVHAELLEFFSALSPISEARLESNDETRPEGESSIAAINASMLSLVSSDASSEHEIGGVTKLADEIQEGYSTSQESAEAISAGQWCSCEILDVMQEALSPTRVEESAIEKLDDAVMNVAKTGGVIAEYQKIATASGNSDAEVEEKEESSDVPHLPDLVGAPAFEQEGPNATEASDETQVEANVAVESADPNAIDALEQPIVEDNLNWIYETQEDADVPVESTEPEATDAPEQSSVEDTLESVKETLQSINAILGNNANEQHSDDDEQLDTSNVEPVGEDAESQEEIHGSVAAESSSLQEDVPEEETKADSADDKELYTAEETESHEENQGSFAADLSYTQEEVPEEGTKAEPVNDKELSTALETESQEENQGSVAAELPFSQEEVTQEEAEAIADEDVSTASAAADQKVPRKLDYDMDAFEEKKDDGMDLYGDVSNRKELLDPFSEIPQSHSELEGTHHSSSTVKTTAPLGLEEGSSSLLEFVSSHMSSPKPTEDSSVSSIGSSVEEPTGMLSRQTSSSSLSSFWQRCHLADDYDKALLCGEEQYLPNLHSSKGPCERCVALASPEERAKFRLEGRSLHIMLVRGGCKKTCTAFPRPGDEPPVRLCRKCYFNTHRCLKGR